MKKYLLVVLSVAFLVLNNNCATNPVSGKKQIVLMSEEQEIAMGQQADPQIIAQYGLYEDQALQNFLTEKGKQMAAISHRPNITYHFRVIDSDVINAFAVPGGYVYFTRGIMAHFNNEAEFAGVLGHEIGHIAARHSVEQQRNMILGQLGIIAGVVIAPELAQFAEAASQGLSLLFLKFGRDAERESDRLGVEYSSKIGYDAQEMSEFFQTLERKGEESGAQELPNFLSTHPNPGDRQRTVAQLAAEMKKQLNLTNPQVNREQYLRRIEGLIYGEDPRQGFRENNMFYHPVLRFQFPIPQGWMYQNSPQSVQIAPQGGQALVMLTLAQGTSLQEAANAAMQKYQLQPVESRQTTVNGLQAIAVVADLRPQQQQQQAQQQQQIRTLNYLIQHGQNIYHLIGVAPANNFNSYAQTFASIMQDFREVTNSSILNRKPDRIRIRTVRQSGTLQQALRSYNVPDNKLNELAIVNGMRLNENVSQGSLIKVVERE